MPQLLNAELIKNLAAHFLRRNGPEVSWMSAIGMHLFFPGVTGFWPGSVGGNLADTPDLSANGQTMTTFGNTQLTVEGFAPVFVIPDDTSYLSTPDAVPNQFGDFFFLGWVKFDALGAVQGLANKWGAVGNYAVRVYKSAADAICLDVSDDGTTITTLAHPATISVSRWYHVAASFTSNSGIMRVYVNAVKEELTVGVPTVLFNSTADFELGRASNGVNDGLIGSGSLFASGQRAEISEIHLKTLYSYTKALYGYR